MDSALYKQVVWDYTLPQADFEAILRGEKVLGSLDQNWAIARVLENLNYYQVGNLVSRSLLKQNWSGIKKKLFKKSVIDGYEFVLQHYSVPLAG